MYLSRKDYAKDPDNVPEEMMCIFCMDVCVQPVQCKGPCKSIACRRCASQWHDDGKKNTVHCPKKCMQVWQCTLLPPKPLPMSCPYSPTCTISYPQQLDPHLKSCPFLPPDLHLKHQQQKNNLCRNNHQLKFFLGTYAQMIESVCSLCGEKQVVRHKCLKCDEKYCVKCRVPVCGKDCCPMGHQYEFCGKITTSAICDLCSMPPSLFGKGIYDDSNCNFGICEICYEKLPETTKMDVKGIRKAQNVCDNGHPLKPVRQAKQQICHGCQKKVLCVKGCEDCNQFFCLKCKQPIVIRGHCQFSHAYTPDQPSKPCMHCHTHPQKSLTDTPCSITLCLPCYTDFQQISSDKRRLKHHMQCPQHHILRYTSSLDFITKCKACQIMKKCQLFCTTCKPIYGMCYECRTPKTIAEGTCMAGDVLVRYPGEEEKLCLVCQYHSKGVWYCKECEFYVCGECREGEEEKARKNKKR